MKTKTLICYLNIIDNCLEKIVDEKSTEKEVNKNLYKYNVIMNLLYVFLTHWKKRNMTYDYDKVSSKVHVNMRHILDEAELYLRHTHNNHDFTNRRYWDIIRRDTKLL